MGLILGILRFPFVLRINDDVCMGHESDDKISRELQLFLSRCFFPSLNLALHSLDFGRKWQLWHACWESSRIRAGAHNPECRVKVEVKDGAYTLR